MLILARTNANMIIQLLVVVIMVNHTCIVETWCITVSYLAVLIIINNYTNRLLIVDCEQLHTINTISCLLNSE